MCSLTPPILLVSPLFSLLSGLLEGRVCVLAWKILSGSGSVLNSARQSAPLVLLCEMPALPHALTWHMNVPTHSEQFSGALAVAFSHTLTVVVI